jgi:pimeloyl-ACP methyl ester carboxylesterase
LPTGPTPSRRRALLAATEPARTLATAGGMTALLPLLRWAPRGEPHPVLVLPGLLASDLSTRVLRAWLGRLDYPVVGWELGRNRGPSQEVVSELPRLVDRLAREHGTTVSIVGWSLGGIYARRLARKAPRQVRQVISLGSPIALVGRPLDRSAGARVYQRLAPVPTGGRISGPRGSLARSLPVPSTAVYSKWDGVVDWRACRQQKGPRSENVAVHASHLGMGHDPAVLWVVADRLAQPPGDWRPFERPTRWGLGRLFPADG